MKLKEIDNALKRYKYIVRRKNDETAVTFYVGKRKKKLDLNEEYEILLDIIRDVIKSESGTDKTILTLWIVKGLRDISIMAKAFLSRSSYYKAKMTKKFKIYCLCASKGLISYEEILHGM